MPAGFELNTAGIKEGVLLNDIVLEEEYVEKDIVYFDFDKSEVLSRYQPNLDRVIGVLKKYPETWLVLGAHADSRGTQEYNQALAERRAAAVVDYMTRRGIERDRITD